MPIKSTRPICTRSSCVKNARNVAGALRPLPNRSRKSVLFVTELLQRLGNGHANERQPQRNRSQRSKIDLPSRTASAWQAIGESGTPNATREVRAGLAFACATQPYPEMSSTHSTPFPPRRAAKGKTFHRLSTPGSVHPRLEIIRSYSSCRPIQNQYAVSPWTSASAR